MSRINDIREREKAATPGPWGMRSAGDCTGEWITFLTPFNIIIDDELPDDDLGFIITSRADIPYLLAKLDEAVELLKRGEWIEQYDPHDHSTEIYCPECGKDKECGHAPDCALNAIIKEVEG